MFALRNESWSSNLLQNCPRVEENYNNNFKKKKRRKKAPSITRGNEIRRKKNCVCHATDLGQERGTAPRLCRIPVDSEGGNFEKNACEM